MTPIAALAPALFPTDLPVPLPGSGETFAPVLAGLLTPAPIACAVAPLVDAALPGGLAPELPLPTADDIADADIVALLPLPATISEAVAQPPTLPKPLPQPLPVVGTPLPLTGRDRPDDVSTAETLPPPRHPVTHVAARVPLVVEPLRRMTESRPAENAAPDMPASEIAVAATPPSTDVVSATEPPPSRDVPAEPALPLLQSAPSARPRPDRAPTIAAEPAVQPDGAPPPIALSPATSVSRVAFTQRANAALPPVHPVAQPTATPATPAPVGGSLRPDHTPAPRSDAAPAVLPVRIAAASMPARHETASPVTIAPVPRAASVDGAASVAVAREQRPPTLPTGTAQPVVEDRPVAAANADRASGATAPLVIAPSPMPAARVAARPSTPDGSRPAITLGVPAGVLPLVSLRADPSAQPVSTVSPFTPSLPVLTPLHTQSDAPTTLVDAVLPALSPGSQPIAALPGIAVTPSPAPVEATAAASPTAVVPSAAPLPAPAVPLAIGEPETAAATPVVAPAAPATVPGIALPTPLNPALPNEPITASPVDRIRAPAPPAAGPARPVEAAPLPPIVAAPVIRPAFQAFGAALHRAATFERKPVSPVGEPLFVTTPAAPMPALVAAAPVDTTQARWPEAMMARVELVRELQNQTDTRIRLHPDALGHIDVAVRREGETVNVHFAAAESATRALLAEAQPRLAELAEAKGLKLAQSSVDGGTGQGGANSDGRRQPAPPQPQTPSRPAAARPAADDPTDTRLA